MAYTTPKTWSNEPLIAGDLNTYVRDNQEALKDPPSANYELNEASDYTTTSTSFVDIDSTNLSLTITTTGGDVMVHFHGVFFRFAGASARVCLDVDVDGTRVGGDDGIISEHENTAHGPITFTRLITGLGAGSHTFKLQWKLGAAGTYYLYAGAGTSGRDYHPQFWVREVS